MLAGENIGKFGELMVITKAFSLKFMQFSISGFHLYAIEIIH